MLALSAVRGSLQTFAWIWLVGAAFLPRRSGGMVAESRHHMAVLANLLRAAGILIAIGILVVGFIGAHIFAGMRQKPEQNLPYVIVLGAQVRGTKVSKALRKRLDCAANVKKENPDTVFFLSGGQGDGEDITEAEAMQEYLIEAGVDASVCAWKTARRRRGKNLKFCNELQSLHTEKSGFLSNDFSYFTGPCQMARQQGYETSAASIASMHLAQPYYVLREVFAVLAATARGKMRI